MYHQVSSTLFSFFFFHVSQVFDFRVAPRGPDRSGGDMGEEEEREGRPRWEGVGEVHWGSKGKDGGDEDDEEDEAACGMCAPVRCGAVRGGAVDAVSCVVTGGYAIFDQGGGSAFLDRGGKSRLDDWAFLGIS